MKVIKDNKVVFSGTLKECVEEITDESKIVQEVRKIIKTKGYCEISLGYDDYIIVK